MKVIIEYIKNNLLAVSVAALAVVILVVAIIIVVARKNRAKRDAEYAKMFEEVPIESDDSEDIDFGDNRPTEFELYEMDWLKGKKSLGGVLRTVPPPLKKTRQANATENGQKTSETLSQLSIDDFTTIEEPHKHKHFITKETNMEKKTNLTDKKTKNKVKTAEKANKKTTKNVKAKTEEPAAKEPDNATAATTTSEATATPAAKKVVGKWLIKEKGEGEFVAYLQANNKEVMLTSETYSTADGAKKGIATIQKNAADENNFTYYCDKNKNYFFKLKTPQNRFLCAGATYPNKSACLKSIESVRKFIDSPVSDAIEKDITIIKYVPPKDSSASDKKYSGKWIIEKIEDAFMAKLYASNGELLLSTESYASYASAKEAIDNITDNGLKGNIIIDSDKKGRYFFKIRNAQKLTLCVSETYAQLPAVTSAIESVRGFLKTSKLQEN